MQSLTIYGGSEQSSPSLNLGGLESQNQAHVIFRKHKRYNTTIRPYKTYRNWARGFQIPWICFMECAIAVLYFFFGFLYQRSMIDFSIDFSKAINDYFLSGIISSDESISIDVPIYFKSQYLEIANETGYRFLNFQDDIPCSNKIYSEGFLYVDYEYTEPHSKEFISGQNIYEKSNVSFLYDDIKVLSENIPQISMSSTYRMEKNFSSQHEDIILKIYSDFTFDERSRIVTLKSHHKRIPSVASFTLNLFITNPLILSLFFISILSFICIIFNVYYIRSTYVYSRQKATNNFQDPKKKFSSKFDRWSIFSLVCHILNITSSFTYIIFSFYYDKSEIPISLILMSLSSFLHSILILRYLKQLPQIMIIVNVATISIIKILEFLVGCIMIFIAYTILGSCLFGTYDETFKSLIESAECLLAVVHGDSIQDMFNSSEFWPDIPDWYGVIFWAVWIFFSLTIFFNISISIFEDVLTREINKTTKEAQDKEHAEEAAKDQFSLTFPISYR